MYKLQDPVYTSSMIGISSVGYSFNNEQLLNSFNGINGTYSRSYKTLKLKNDANLIPIVNVLNSRSRIMNIPRDVFVKNEIKNVSSMLMNNNTALDTNEEIKTNLIKMYDEVLNLNANDFSCNIFIGASNVYVSNSRVDTQQQLLISSNNGNYAMPDSNSIIGTFYYISNDKILLTLMVKKEFIPDFKKNIMEGFIDPTHVEIWIDKSLLSEDRKKLHKWIRDTLLMKLVMNGFKIVEKDDIIAELIYFPKIRFRSPSEISEFKMGINRLVLDE